MMNCDETRERLYDYADGVVTPDESSMIELHLGSCAECRADLEEIRSLLNAVDALPMEIEPARDLWPGILAAGVPEPQPQPNNVRALPRLWMRPAYRIAAMIAVVITTVSLIILATGDDQPARPIVRSDTADAQMEQVSSDEARYARARRDLFAALDRQKEALSPETIEVVERNLRIIDESIQEIREALDRDPDNQRLYSMLLEMQRREIDLLQQATTLPTL